MGKIIKVPKNEGKNSLVGENTKLYHRAKTFQKRVREKPIFRNFCVVSYSTQYKYILCKRYEKRELFSHLSFGLSQVHLMTVFLLHHVQNTTISNSFVMYLNQAIFFTFIINFCKYVFHTGNNIFQEILRFQWHYELPMTAYNTLLGLYLPVMILGTTLNLILLCTMLTNKKLRADPRNTFILALAFSDFFLCNFTSPLTLWATLEGHWPFGKFILTLLVFDQIANAEQ